MAYKPVDITDEEFDQIVLAAEKPVVVDFWAEWCAPCHTVAIWMQNLARLHGDKLSVVKIDADQNPETIAAYNILGLPTILFFNQGQLVHRQTDEIDESGLLKLVEMHF